MATYRKFGAKSRRQDKHEILGYTCMIAPSLVQTMANYQEFILETTTCLGLHVPQHWKKKSFTLSGVKTIENNHIQTNKDVKAFFLRKKTLIAQMTLKVCNRQ